MTTNQWECQEAKNTGTHPEGCFTTVAWDLLQFLLWALVLVLVSDVWFGLVCCWFEIFLFCFVSLCVYVYVS